MENESTCQTRRRRVLALALRVGVSLIRFQRRPPESCFFTISITRVPQNAPIPPPMAASLSLSLKEEPSKGLRLIRALPLSAHSLLDYRPISCTSLTILLNNINIFLIEEKFSILLVFLLHVFITIRVIY